MPSPTSTVQGCRPSRPAPYGALVWHGMQAAPDLRTTTLRSRINERCMDQLAGRQTAGNAPYPASAVTPTISAAGRATMPSTLRLGQPAMMR